MPMVDPKGLLEYSVVFNDRSLNHMAPAFQQIMRDIASTLKRVYQADAIAIVPGSGTFGMEAVARQFATDKTCLIIRNGWFSYRWTQIFETGGIAKKEIVLKARPLTDAVDSAFEPPALETVLAVIRSEKPDLLFAAHVETAAGMILPDFYLKAVADAVHEVGGLFILDCIASGAAWVDMKATGVDILLSAPQKGWSASPCCALVMLSPRAHKRIETTKSTSFAGDLLKWLQIMKAYEAGGYAYHATMPTDALARFHGAMREMEELGFGVTRDRQWELGTKARAAFAKRGYKSTAAEGFEAPGVLVHFTQNDAVQNGKAFAELGLQTAAGVPLMCDEGPGFKTFRLGLFGLDKLAHIDRTVKLMEDALERLPR